MTERKEATPLQKNALASLGRNVLHFQRLEAQLKLLALFCEFQSPVDKFTANHKQQAEKIRLITMGTVVNALHKSLYGKPPDPQGTTIISKGILTIGFRVDADTNYINRQKQKLNDLVAERNQLIHHDLAGFDPTSADSCRDWVTRLDQQNERILLQLNATQQLIDICKQAFQKMLPAMES